jgi:outer membrane lipopolysaccharide assembly protein LptE/RlpB
MIKKTISLIFIIPLIISCGFTPILKDIKNQNNTLVYYEINSSNSYQARQLLNSTFINIDKDKAKFITKVNISETESAVNIESSGSVNEYKVEVEISFKIFENKTNSLIFQSQTRGFANYDVSNSEYTNTLVKSDALEKALTSGMQLMRIIVQSKTNQ